MTQREEIIQMRANSSSSNSSKQTKEIGVQWQASDNIYIRADNHVKAHLRSEIQTQHQRAPHQHLKSAIPKPAGMIAKSRQGAMSLSVLSEGKPVNESFQRPQQDPRFFSYQELNQSRKQSPSSEVYI